MRDRLIESYDVLFSGQEADAISAVGNFNGKYGWIGQIYFLCQYDITRVENITKLGLHECLLMLTFMKEKNELEARELKRKYK